jgi:hypothetical protein
MMRKQIQDRGDVIAVRAKPEDAVATVRRMRGAIQERLSENQQPLITNAERDILLVAIAQQLGILS